MSAADTTSPAVTAVPARVKETLLGTVVIFTFALVVNEYVYAITFISTSTERTISAGVPTELIRGDVFFWGSLMAATLLPAIPLALLYNVFLDRFIAGFTGGAFR